MNFSDAGLFGVKFSGAADAGEKLLSDVIRELKKLGEGVNPNELERAKNILKRNVY